MEHQMSMFEMISHDEPLTDYENVLTRGSGFAGGKVRIYAATLNLSVSELAVYLKEEYGVGGHSMDYMDGSRGFVDYGANGMEIKKWDSDDSEKHGWNDIAKGIKRLISTDRYLTETERKTVKAIQSNHGGILPTPVPRFHYE